MIRNEIAPGSLVPLIVGVNGFGRMGKIFVWHLIANQLFERIVVNMGRELGRNINDVINYLIKDSTYGSLGRYIYGHRGYDKDGLIQNVDTVKGTFLVNGVHVQILREARIPELINWKKHGVRLVAEMTGKFKDYSTPAGKNGSLCGHFIAGAEAIVLSAPFSVENKNAEMPENCITLIAGINEELYEPEKHSIVSAGSCTSTCVAHLVNPLLKRYSNNILNAHMLTIHASTGSQEVLDRAPKAGAKDQRKTRSVFNNIILTSTGAAKVLPLVIKEIKGIEFNAISARIPASTGSMVMLNLTLNTSTNIKIVNSILEAAAKEDLDKYLIFDETQNVSSDVIGSTAACIVEAEKTQVSFSEKANGISNVVLFAWYDNEWGYARVFTRVFSKVAKKFIPALAS
jgi:glyceraldehyde 3-phosphate dehydrogenase